MKFLEYWEYERLKIAEILGGSTWDLHTIPSALSVVGPIDIPKTLGLEKVKAIPLLYSY